MILQVALSLVLLVGAGLFVRSLWNLKAVDDGYNTDQVVTAALDPAQSGYKLDQLRNFYVQLSERVSALPGVKSATYTRNVPMSGRYSRIGIEVPGYQSPPGRRDGGAVQPGSARNSSQLSVRRCSRGATSTRRITPDRTQSRDRQ